MKDGGPAFPVPQGYLLGDDDKGMSLRDYFAGQAIRALLADPSHDEGIEWLAEYAYAWADAMLKARE